MRYKHRKHLANEEEGTLPTEDSRLLKGTAWTTKPGAQSYNPCTSMATELGITLGSFDRTLAEEGNGSFLWKAAVIPVVPVVSKYFHTVFAKANGDGKESETVFQSVSSVAKRVGAHTGTLH